MEYMNMKNIFGENESSYSKAIAQTFLISEEFKKLFVNLVNSKHDNQLIKGMTSDEVIKVILENNFDGNKDRIDILFEFKNELHIGIENKRWALLQKAQLTRYWDRFEEMKHPYILVFLAPKKYNLLDSEKPKVTKKGVFVQINYNEIYDICKKILDQSQDSLTKNYFTSLLNFAGELIMQPLNSQEINSLIYFKNAEKKVVQIIKEINVDNSFIEKNPNYILTNQNINSQSCFLGFRLGRQWYYDEPLIKDLPEIIFYVKDIESDSAIADTNNKKLNDVFTTCRNELETQFECKVNYYDRKRVNECRLAIRKALSDFEYKDPDDICKWFNDIREYMKQKL